MTEKIVYGAVSGSVAACDLLVDYNLVRLNSVPGFMVRCCEIADLEEQYKYVFMNVPPHTPKAQLAWDFASVAQSLPPDGNIVVRIHDRKALRMTKRILSTCFAEVKQRSGRLPELIGLSPAADAPAPSPLECWNYNDIHAGSTLTLISRPGLFSSGHVDEGTSLLLKNLRDVSGARLLDVGCGYGAIGLSAAARGAHVTMVDCDARSVACSRLGLAENGLSGEVLLHDGVGALSRDSFDFVLSNPPTHAGSNVLQKLFSDMTRVAKRNGSVLLVIREHLNYEKWLRDLGSVSCLERSAGFKVLEVG